MEIRKFISQFLNDWRKIVWPSRTDVVYFFIMSLVLAGLFALFFMLADRVVSLLVNYFLDL